MRLNTLGAVKPEFKENFWYQNFIDWGNFNIVAIFTLQVPLPTLVINSD